MDDAAFTRPSIEVALRYTRISEICAAGDDEPNESFVSERWKIEALVDELMI